jgi:hypothetical protein
MVANSRIKYELVFGLEEFLFGGEIFGIESQAVTWLMGKK